MRKGPFEPSLEDPDREPNESGQCTPPSDVDGAEGSAEAAAAGAAYTLALAVPEPARALLLATGALVLLATRRVRAGRR
jgi:hypothetical protein